MTTQQADRLIQNLTEVTVRNELYRETFTTTFTHRDRFNIYDVKGECFDRGELEIIVANE